MSQQDINIHSSYPTSPLLRTEPVATAKTSLTDSKTKEISQATFSHIEGSHQIHDYHFVVARKAVPEFPIQDYHMTITRTFQKAHPDKTKGKRAVPSLTIPQTVGKTIVQDMSKELKALCTKRDALLQTTARELSYIPAMISYIRTKTTTYEHAEKMLRGQTLSKDCKEIKKLNEKLIAQANAIANQLLHCVERSILTKKDAIKIFGECLDSIYTEKAFTYKKTEQLLMRLTLAKGEKKPDKTSDEIDGLSDMRIFMVTNDQIEAEQTQISKQKNSQLDAFKARLSDVSAEFGTRY